MKPSAEAQAMLRDYCTKRERLIFAMLPWHKRLWRRFMQLFA